MEKMPRESEPKRHHSRFHREPSPKRSRRDGKPRIERSPSRLSPDIRDKDDDRKHHHRLQDPLPLEKPHASESKHNDRSNSGHNGASTDRIGKPEHGRVRSNEDGRRRKYHQASSDALEKDKKSVARRDDSRVRRHEEPSKTNADQPQPTKKKFREEKPPLAESKPTEKDVADPVKPAQLEGAAARSGRREERGMHRYPDRNERDRGYAGGRFQPNRARGERAAFPSRDRYQDSISGNRFRGREGYIERQGVRAGGGDGHVDKWKHDLFDEVNKGKPDEEDHVAKVKALLAL